MFMDDTCLKNMRIHFPNGERSDICNDNIAEDSTVLEQVLCSEDTLKFGLCSSARFECTVAEIEKNGERGNIKNCKIQVYMEIDVSSLTEEEIAEYGQTSDDVPYPYYRVPMFTGTVKSCKKQSNMDMRKIIAYDGLNSDVLDQSISEWIKQYKADASGGGADFENCTTVFLPHMTLNNVFSCIMQYVGMPLKTTDELVNYSGVYLKPLPTNYGVGASTTSPTYVFEKGVTSKLIGGSFIPPLQSKNIKIVVEFNMDVVHELNQVLNKKNGTNYTDKERISILKRVPVFFGITTVTASEDDEYGTNTTMTFEAAARMLPGTVVQAEEISGLISGRGVSLSVGYPGRIYDEQTGTEYPVIEALKIYNMDDALDTISTASIVLDYDESKNTINGTSAEKIRLRDMIGSFLELDCAFGKIDANGEFEVRTLQKPFWELSEQWRVSDSWILNYSRDSRIPAGEEVDGWYDEDYDDSLYGAVKLLGENNTLLAKYVGNPDGLKTYCITDNIILNSCISDKWVILSILKKMFEKIQTYRNTPMQIQCAHSPQRETGDKIILNDNGKEVATYIFNKVTTGIVSVFDETDTTNMTQ